MKNSLRSKNAREKRLKIGKPRKQSRGKRHSGWPRNREGRSGNNGSALIKTTMGNSSNWVKIRVLFRR
jgi:hypothetical protein